MRESGSLRNVFGIKEAFHTFSLVYDKSMASTPGHKTMEVVVQLLFSTLAHSPDSFQPRWNVKVLLSFFRFNVGEPIFYIFNIFVLLHVQPWLFFATILMF